MGIGRVSGVAGVFLSIVVSPGQKKVAVKTR